MLAPAEPALATTFVGNCADSGVGTLRAAVAGAGEFGTVDMTSLNCGRITLHTGITVPWQNLKIAGPGAGKLIIDTKYQFRVFEHPGTGTFEVDDVTISGGYVQDVTAKGGCIFSEGTVSLLRSTVSECKAVGIYAFGGAIFANQVILTSSQLLSNTVTAIGGGIAAASGGGAFAASATTLNNAVVSGNSAIPGANGSAGGLDAGGSTSIAYSTLSGNYASGGGGAVVAWDSSSAPGGSFLLMRNSTVSGNSSGTTVGGISSRVPTTLEYITVAFNTANAGSSGGTYHAPGVDIRQGGAPTATISGILLSNNTYGPTATENDLSSAVTLAKGVPNFVRASTSSLPSGTLLGVCPHLGPLRDNGGPTATHALLSGSQAINKIALTPDAHVSADQRNAARDGVRDMGAYEVQHGDIVFDDGFDGCG